MSMLKDIVDSVQKSSFQEAGSEMKNLIKSIDIKQEIDNFHSIVEIKENDKNLQPTLIKNSIDSICTVKTESNWNNLETENFLSNPFINEQNKPTLEFVSLGKTEENILNFFCDAALDKRQNFCSSDHSLLTEISDSLNKNERKMKCEKIDVNNEDLESRDVGFGDCFIQEIDIPVKTENSDLKFNEMHGIIFSGSNIEHEEVDIKEEGDVISMLENCDEQKKHRDSRTYKCSSCDFQTIHRSSIYRHLHQHKNLEEGNQFQCDQCDYKTILQHHLNKHLLKHKPKKVDKFKCSQCDFQTVYKGSLKIHQILHNSPWDIKWFECPHCGYRAIRKDHLKLHLVIHKNQEEIVKFKCDECDFQTIHKSYLKVHKRKHMKREKVYKFKCDQCDYKATLKHLLKGHLLKHKKVEELVKFQCNECDYQTTRKINLKNHFLIRHKDLAKYILFKCSQCDFQTSYKSNLNRHVLKHKKN